MTNLKDNTSCMWCNFPLAAEVPLAINSKITLMIGKHNYSDSIFLFARYIDDYDTGEDVETGDYYPKFCPECGKRINKNIRSE